MSGGRVLSYIALILTIMLLGTAAASASPSSSSSITGRPVSVCVTPARAGQHATDLFSGRIRVDCGTPQSAYRAGDYWVLSQPFSAHGKVAVRSASLWQNARTVYGLYADGVILSRHTDSRMATRTLQMGAIFSDMFPARPAPLVRLAWRIDGSANLRGILNGTHIATMRENSRSNLYLIALYAGFAGLCVALIVHHFALWTAMRHRFQLAYCVMVMLLLTYAFTSSGAAAWAFPGLDNNDRLRFNYVVLGLAAAVAIVFARTFFEERVFAKWVDLGMKLIATAVILATSAFAIFAPWHAAMFDRLVGYAFLALLLFTPVFLFRAWYMRSNHLWLFAMAWSAPVIFAGLRVANAFDVIGWNFWIDNSTVVSMTAEALLSSLGITYRIRLLSRERDDARLKELAARALADADPLTGLLNRRAFLRQAIGRTGEQTLLVLDIDHFKLVNETIGHDGGDEVLLLVARALRAVAPAEALVARIGGEEFAIVMHATNPITGEDVLARLRSQRMPFDLTVTASIGICRGPLLTETDWKRLYRLADRALYDAKTDGRDRARTSPQALTAA